jgi:radical SAM protein with 4Fe4S-binding SPASM domain
MSYQQENNEIVKNFLERTYFKAWREWEAAEKDTGYFLNNYRNLEFDLSDVCELKCSYCYVTKFGKQYFPDPALKNPQTIFDNAKVVMDWLWENQMRPKLELFGGDALNQKVGFDIINEVITRAEAGKPSFTEIIVPTNMNFLLDDDKIILVEDFIERGKKVNLPLFLSASVDGIYMEDNRSFRSNRKRDEQFYDKLFKFAKKYHFGFHPMVYSENIEKWWDNFLWFQRKFKEYDLPPTSMYLLEVRNAEWNEEQCKHLYEFLKKLTMWVTKNLQQYEDPAREFYRKKWSFNTLSNPFSHIGRGLGCSLQSSMYLRMGDLTTFPCHRLMYDYFKLFRFIKKDEKITDIEAITPELLFATNSTNTSNFPVCEHCIANSICSYGCLGAQFENTGDMFVPIPSMCRMEFYRLKGIFEGFKESGLLDGLLGMAQDERKKIILRFMEETK